MHAHMPLTDAACDEVAMRFRALSEPMRLKILNALRVGDHLLERLR